MDEAVVLIVKAPNQQIEDQTVHCQINWTIKMLKGHLSEVYPSKPRLEDQKLIYSGQLLTDNSTLKDVLRSYEGQKNHTLHLVCSPTKESLKASNSSFKKPASVTPTQPASPDQSPTAAPTSGIGEGLRHRGGPVYSSPYSPFTFTQPPAAQAPPVWPVLGTYDPASLAQQMAWMQQAYAQYMTQYMQLMASGNVPMVMQMPPTVNNVPAAAPPLRDEPVPVNEPAPNIEDEEELRANRDWLDWFYIMGRVLVLFSIVYFYSSPVRFFLVSTLGLIMYLYQIGFFRALQRLDQQEQQEEVPETPPPTPDNNNISPAENPPPPPPAPSALAITWAAFSSFFLSLIPEQPNIL